MKKHCPSLALLICFVLGSNAAAEDYDYEIGLAYGMGTADSTVVSTLNGVPTPSLGVATSSSDADTIGLTGAWYYSGLSDSEGPKSRAGFLSRASSVVVGYSRGDDSGSFEFTGGGVLPPVTGSTDTTTNSFAGWFVREHIEISARYRQDNPATFPGTDADNNEVGVGVRVRF